MGVQGLSALLKSCASSVVNLTSGDGRVIIDGHFLAHKHARGKAALSLVASGEVSLLLRAMEAEVRAFQRSGWSVTVLFDGSTPPSKEEAGRIRRLRREVAARKLRTALEAPRHERPGEDEMHKMAGQAVCLTPKLIASLSDKLRSSTSCATYTSIFEADGQLRVFEMEYSKDGKACYVYTADSDAIVLGCNRILTNVHRDATGCVTRGNCIEASLLHNPPQHVLQDGSKGQLVRMLHAVSWEDVMSGTFHCSAPEDVNERLMTFAYLAGNDYVSFPGIGWKTAINLVRRYGTNLIELAEAVASFSSRRKERIPDVTALSRLYIARVMYRDQVVWRVLGGAQHLSGGKYTRQQQEKITGLIPLPDAATSILRNRIHPATHLPWTESEDGLQDRVNRKPLGEGVNIKSNAGSPNPPSAARKDACGEPTGKRTQTAGDHCFHRWTIDQLKEYLKQFPFMERAGVSDLRKSQFVTMAEAARDMCKSRSRKANPFLVRKPVEDDTPTSEKRTPPKQEEWLRDWTKLKANLPIIQMGVIAEWVWEKCPGEEIPKRILERGFQRALDLGALKGLRAVIDRSDSYGETWVGFSPKASMRDIIYDVWAVLRVVPHDLPGYKDTTGASNARKLAIRVAEAHCGCVAGKDGGCHHVCTLLQLIRVLGMTSDELAKFGPVTATGRQCTWIQRYREGGSDREGDIWWGMTADEIAEKARQLPNPRRRTLSEVATEPKLRSRGVPSRTRMTQFNAVPSGERWERLSAAIEVGHLPDGSMSSLRFFLECCKVGRAAAGKNTSRSLAMSYLVPGADDTEGISTDEEYVKGFTSEEDGDIY